MLISRTTGRGHGATNRHTALQRLGLLCDERTLQVLRSGVVSPTMGEQEQPGDGVVGAAGRIAGRPVFCYAQDGRFAGGSLGEGQADTIVRQQRLAAQARVPLIGFIESGGARIQEGIAALNGYSRIFAQTVALSGKCLRSQWSLVPRPAKAATPRLSQTSSS